MFMVTFLSCRIGYLIGDFRYFFVLQSCDPVPISDTLMVIAALQITNYTVCIYRVLFHLFAPLQRTRAMQ